MRIPAPARVRERKTGGRPDGLRSARFGDGTLPAKEAAPSGRSGMIQLPENSSPGTVVRFGNPGTTARSQSFRSSGRPSVRAPASFEEGISGAPFFAAEPEGAEPGVPEGAEPEEPEEPEKPAESKSDPPQEVSSVFLFRRAASVSSCFCLHRSMSPKNRNAPTAQTPAASQEYIAPTGMTDATKIAEMTVKIILSVFKKFPPFRGRRSFPIRSGLL